MKKILLTIGLIVGFIGLNASADTIRSINDPMVQAVIESQRLQDIIIAETNERNQLDAGNEITIENWQSEFTRKRDEFNRIIMSRHAQTIEILNRANSPKSVSLIL